MFICSEVLSSKEAAEYIKQLNDWSEGQSALGANHKNNLEIKDHMLCKEIQFKILSHPKLNKYSFIKQMTTPRFNKYVKSGKYDSHVDFFRQENLRTDWSMTLFLSDPNSYEGGELVIQDSLGERQFKLSAGDMIVYPSGSIHRVNPVLKGERIAVITWAESYVEDYNNRNILSHLVDLMIAPKDKEQAVKLSYIYNNLLRKWS